MDCIRSCLLMIIGFCKEIDNEYSVGIIYVNIVLLMD